MNSIQSFNDATLNKLFGSDDAENENIERFKEYFFYNKTFKNLDNELPIRLLVGHKGIGKSAFLKRAYLNDLEKNRLAIYLKPSDIHDLQSTSEPSNFVSLVNFWKKNLLTKIAERVLEEFATISNSESTNDIKTNILEYLSKIFQEKLNSISDKSNKAIVNTFLKNNAIHVYIDDIDRGWSASNKDIKNISALLNAIRDISGDDQRIRFRIALRTDVYYLVRTSDESTDKIDSNIVWLTWNNHEILCIIAKRITTYFGEEIDQNHLLKMSQKEITNQILSKIIEPRFKGQGHWKNQAIHKVLLSLTRRRPRDLVKLMRGAAKNSFNNNSQHITTHELEDSFSSYSQERLQDIINEFKTELPNIEALLFGFRPSARGRRASDHFLFPTDKLVKKIKNIRQNVTLTFKNGNYVTERGIIQFLYKIDFITARKNLDKNIERKHFDQNRFLASEITEFGYDWEVHPAYRWALEPQSNDQLMNKIFADRK